MDRTEPCGRCERLPDMPTTPGRLFLWPPLGHSGAKVAAALQGRTRAVSEGSGGALVVEVAEDLEGLVADIDVALTKKEQDDTRCLYVAGERDPGLEDFGAVTALARFVGLVSGRWLLELLGEDRLTTHFQPIVDARDPTRPVAHECLMRGVTRDGTMIAPGRLLSAANDADLRFVLDRAARTGAVRRAAAAGVATRLFINFLPSAIYDPVFCLRTTRAAVAEAGFEPGEIVFEVVESDHIDDPERLRSILEYYRSYGFKVALDDLGSGFASLSLLGALRPEVVKLDMELLRDVDRDPVKAVLAAKLLEMARDMGIETVCEGIEREGEYRWVRDHGADMVQGFLFAKPSATPMAAS